MCYTGQDRCSFKGPKSKYCNDGSLNNVLSKDNLLKTMKSSFVRFVENRLDHIIFIDINKQPGDF